MSSTAVGFQNQPVEALVSLVAGGSIYVDMNKIYGV